MANTFKLKTKANVGTATSDVYVVPAATTTVVIGVTLANTTAVSYTHLTLPTNSSV